MNTGMGSVQNEQSLTILTGEWLMGKVGGGGGGGGLRPSYPFPLPLALLKTSSALDSLLCFC